MQIRKYLTYLQGTFSERGASRPILTVLLRKKINEN